MKSNLTNFATYGISGGKTSVKILIESVFALAVGADASKIFRSVICREQTQNAQATPDALRNK